MRRREADISRAHRSVHEEAAQYLGLPVGAGAHAGRHGVVGGYGLAQPGITVGTGRA